MRARFFHLRVPVPMFEELFSRDGKVCTVVEQGAGVAPKGGATVKVSPIEGSPDKVLFQWAQCSKHDMFCRKIGREEAEKHDGFVIQLEELGNWLEVRHYRTLRQAGFSAKVANENVPNYLFASKYFYSV